MLRIAKIMLITLAILGLPLTSWAEEIPTLKVGYVFTTHHTPLLVAASQGETFNSQGVYLKMISPKERYELMVHGKPVAVLDLVVTKSGAETATLFAQKHLALASVTAIMAGVDKGTPIKVLAPLQTEGMALVAPKDSPLKSWDDFVAMARQAKEPVKVGYHSPTSAPKIVLEGALKQTGLRVTQDPNDGQAQVLLADLKETTNMIPALASRQVDAVVGPSPFPEVAVTRGVGKILVDLRDLPPAGHWHDYPCCVVACTLDTMSGQTQAVAAFVELMARTNQWCNQNRAEAGAISARWIGIPEEAGRASNLVFLPAFNQSWMRGTASYLDLLNGMGNFKGRLQGKKLEEVKGLLLDTSFSDQVKF